MKNMYSFNNNTNSVDIFQNDLPNPWINYLSNGRLSAIVSQAGGGFVWYNSASDCRITRYRYNALPKDSPGFYIYIKEGDTVWSPTFRPVGTALDNWQCSHSTGYSKFVATKGEITVTLTLYVVQETDALVWRLNIDNHGSTNHKLKIFAYCELAQFLWQYEQWHGYYWRHMLTTSCDEDNQILYYFYHFPVSQNDQKTMPLVYFAGDTDVASYSCDRDEFIGNYRSESNPIAVENGKCSNSTMQSGEPCFALHNEIVLEAKAKKEIKYFLGVSGGAIANYDKAIEDSVKPTLCLITF